MESESTHSWFLGYNFVYQEGVDWKWIDTNGNAQTSWNKTLYLSPAAVGGGSLETKQGIPLKPWKVLRGTVGSESSTHNTRVSVNKKLDQTILQIIKIKSLYENKTNEKIDKYSKSVDEFITNVKHKTGIGIKRFTVDSKTYDKSELFAMLRRWFMEIFPTNIDSITGIKDFGVEIEKNWVFDYSQLLDPSDHEKVIGDLHLDVLFRTMKITKDDYAHTTPTIRGYDWWEGGIHIKFQFEYNFIYTKVTNVTSKKNTSTTTTPTITIT